MRYLIAIDSDGTLRHSDGTISVETKKAVKRLVNKNHIVVISTARPRYYTLKIKNEVGASNFLISSNGSEIYDSFNKKLIWASYIKSDCCEKLYSYAKLNNIRIMFVLENTEYVTHFVRNENQVLLTDNNYNDVINGNVKQVMVIGKDKEKILSFQKTVMNEYKMNILDSSDMLKDEIWFSIVSNDTSKGIALIKLAEYLKIPVNNIIAIGNDKNDISMFKVAKKSVSVGNGTEEAKKNAKIVIDSNDADGVAKFLNTLNI